MSMCLVGPIAIVACGVARGQANWPEAKKAAARATTSKKAARPGQAFRLTLIADQAPDPDRDARPAIDVEVERVLWMQVDLRPPVKLADAERAIERDLARIRPAAAAAIWADFGRYYSRLARNTAQIHPTGRARAVRLNFPRDWFDLHTKCRLSSRQGAAVVLSKVMAGELVDGSWKDRVGPSPNRRQFAKPKQR